MNKKQRTNAVEYINKPDSIEVTRSAKGDYSWKVKIYYDSESKVNAHSAVIGKLAKIDDELKKKFK